MAAVHAPTLDPKRYPPMDQGNWLESLRNTCPDTMSPDEFREFVQRGTQRVSQRVVQGAVGAQGDIQGVQAMPILVRTMDV